MYSLIVKHKGKSLQEIELQANTIYIAGRSHDNQIVLSEQVGISRKHLEISLQDNKLIVKKLSSLHTLTQDGEEKENLELSVGQTFQVQNYEFLLKKNLKENPSSQKTEYMAEDIIKQETQHFSLAGRLNPLVEKPEEELSCNGKTTVLPTEEVNKKLIAYLKVSTNEKSPHDIYKLRDQQEWVLGREPSCDLIIDNINISRAHFKITKENSQFFITDLKSSNGTFLNDKELKPQKAYAMESGDVIYILDVEILFEIKDVLLEQELMRLKLPPLPVKVSQEVSPQQAHLVPTPYSPPPLLPEGIPNAIVEGDEELERAYQHPQTRSQNKRLWIYGIIAATVAVFFLLSEKKQESKQISQSETQNVETTSGLSPEEQELIREIYFLAQQKYTQGKYEQCQSEIKQLHTYTDSYKQSRELEVQCVQAAEYKIQKMEIEQKNKKAKQTEEFIQKTTDQCQAKFETFTEKEALLHCLAPARDLSPADSRIQVLIEQFEAKELLKKERRKKIAKRQALIQSILKKYTQSKALYEEGKIEKAMDAYKKFIKISKHKELKDTREQAQRELATITKDFNDNIENLNNECEQPFQNKQFKEAYYTCLEASKSIPPSHNHHVHSIMDKSKEQLKIQMKPLYEEATINESMGNISTATDYWGKIIQQDVDSGIYYQKAKIKLKNY